MRNVNKVVLLGNLGRPPEIRHTQAGNRIATLSIATTHRWVDRTGEAQEKADWHRVIVLAEALIKSIEALPTGALLSIEGYLQTRSYKKNGANHYMTEIIVGTFDDRPGSLTVLQEKRFDRSDEGEATE